MSTVSLLPKVLSQQRIVALLREQLAAAEAGNIQGLFMYVEGTDGKVTHYRDGQSDEHIIFSIELTKRRILGKYTE